MTHPGDRLSLVFAIKSLNVEGGGAERVLVQLANSLVERGHTVAILTFDGPGRSFYPLAAGVERLDMAIGTPGHPTPRFKLLASLPKMRRLVRERRPDVAIGFMHSMYVPFGAALWGARIPVIASEHAGFHHFHGRWAQRAMVRLGQALFFAKTVPSEPVRTAHPPREREQVFVLPNPLDLARFEGISDQPPSDPPTILTVGRFMEEKNQTELIEAFALLAADYPTWTLRLVGDGVMREELERVVEKNRLSTRVEMPGATQEVAAEYRAASIVAVPSLYESFGMVTAEAQASGRPVIGFADCSGTNELIENEKNGLLVAGGSARVASLAAGLRRLMDDAALRARLGAAGPRSVDQFSIERVVDVWENFLQACKAGTLYH